MARPIKTGIVYFSFDVDFFSDKKIKIVKSQYGADGVLLYIYLLCAVYGDQGYYTRIDDDFEYIAADDLNMSSEKIGQIMNFLLGRSLFNDTLFRSDKVLTSRGIQLRYQEAVKTRASKNPITVNEKFWLLNEKETKGFIKVRHSENYSEKNADYSEKNESCSAEKHTKKSKEKKSKVEESKVISPLAQAVEDFREYRRKMKKPMTDRAVELLYQKLDELAGNNEKDKIAILQQSIVNGWQGVFPLKDQRSGTISKAPEGNVFLKMLKEYEDDD